jgi:hypothetical protein
MFVTTIKKYYLLTRALSKDSEVLGTYVVMLNRLLVSNFLFYEETQQAKFSLFLLFLVVKPMRTSSVCTADGLVRCFDCQFYIICRLVVAMISFITSVQPAHTT